jgi:hypothetical protein
MNDCISCMVAFGVDTAARARMESRVIAWLDAAQTPLWHEWLAMLRTAPVRGLSFSVAAAVVLLLTTTLASLLRLLP